MNNLRRKFVSMLLFISFFSVVACLSGGVPTLVEPAKPPTFRPTQATPTLNPTVVPTLMPPPVDTVPVTMPQPAIGDDGNLYMGDTLILDPIAEAPGCFGIGKVSPNPTGEFFLVVMDCFEGDNEAFLFHSDGSGKTRLTGKWSYLNYHDFEWSEDGRYLFFHRINSCCASNIPADAPPEGRIRYDLQTGEETVISSNW